MANTLFIVYENIQCNDSDGWAHWIDKRHLSYHLSREGAEKMIQELIRKKVMEIPELMKLNPSIPDQHWIERTEMMERNVTSLSLTNNGDFFEEEEWFGINQVELLP
jgi:hypothetical protein